MDNLQYQKYLELEYKFRNNLLSYGYIPKQANLIQPANLFLTRAGDQIIEKLVTFTQNGQELSLRPEFTSIAADQYTQEITHRDVIRWQYSGKIFENMPHHQQKEEKFSIGAELIGLDSVEADAEIISMAYSGLPEELAESSTLVIGHTGLLRHILEQFQLDKRTYQFLLAHRKELRNPAQGKQYVISEIENFLFGTNNNESRQPFEGNHTEYENSTNMILQDILHTSEYVYTMGNRDHKDITRRLLRKQNRVTEKASIVNAISFLEKWISIIGPVNEAFSQIESLVQSMGTHANRLFDKCKQLISLLEVYGIPPHKIEIQTDLARDWNYYTGIVFGVRSNSGQYILGGGRYDELISLINNDYSIPAVGFAYYMDTLLNETVIKNSLAERKTFSLHFDSEHLHLAVSISKQLRANGLSVSLESDNTKFHTTSILIGDENQLTWNNQQYATVEDLLSQLKVFIHD